VNRRKRIKKKVSNDADRLLGHPESELLLKIYKKKEEHKHKGK